MLAPVDTILSEYRARLEDIYGPRLVRLILFGSRARGDAEEDSDIDVLIVLDGPFDDWEETKHTSRLTSDLSIKHGADLARMFVSSEEYDQKKASFLDSVRRDGIAI